MKQVSFDFAQNYNNEFGGSLLISKRKSKRPLSTKLPIHFILRADSSKIFPPGNLRLESTLKFLSEKYQIRIFHKSFNWNHFHAVIQIPSREAYFSFVRLWTAEIVKIRKQAQAFKLRPYTRVGSWGRDFENLIKYQDKNNCEAWGLTKAQFDWLEESLRID
jgi:REP element-mobilizing transposase RayT